MKTSSLISIMLCIGALLIVGLLFRGQFWGMYIDNTQGHLLEVPVSTSASNTQITIAPGSSVSTIASLLAEKEMIQSKDLFIRYVDKNQYAASLQSGNFVLSPSMNIPTIVGYLTGTITPDQVSITIPEGLTVRELATLLENKGLTTYKEVMSCIEQTCDFSSYKFLPKQVASMHFDHSYIEGYLFPDTYFIDKDTFTLEQFFGRMLTNFNRRVVVGLKDELAASDYTLEEIVTMASIIEKESRPRDNREIVAGLLWKRLENNVQLATDATNRYIKEDPLEPIYKVELLSNDPYNTRRQKGLTPSAISSPGLSSIQAALNPEDSAYWYYLHDNSGQIHFSSTEAEHERNKNTYLR